MGSLYVSPSVEQSVGYDSNPGEVQGGKGSAALRTDAEIKLRSDWSSNQLTGDLRGGYFHFPDVKGADRPDGDGRLDLRLDATKDFDVLTEIRGSLTTQLPDSVNLPVATKSRPLVYGYGASIAANYHPGYWHFTLRGNIDRTEYANAILLDGTVFDQSDRDLTQYELRARLGYDVSPAFRPFVEVRADARPYDRRFDFSGFARTSDGMAALLGTGIEFTRTLTGEIAAGYGHRSYEDARLKDLSGPLTEAFLIWSVTPLTTVTLKNSTQFVETTLAGSPGALEHQIGLEVSHALLRNFIITGNMAWTRDHYDTNVERDTSITAGVKAEWKLNRNFVVKASFLHTQEITNVAGRGYGENIYLIGARVQY
ncbi:MAG: outer membrane beta-barrel protein [Hyphomicrobiales bacterium]|nr:outer membrane beta-barrel protein [Hyphomicrobiales bacterium]